MSDRGRGRGGGKKTEAPSVDPGRSREALARSFDASLNQFLDAIGDVERRVGDDQEAAFNTVEQALEKLVKLQDEMMLFAPAREHRPSGHGNRPPRNQ